jgi:localization factor PodJL
MSAGGPWSVKGIDPRARARAKTAARREGMTLGEWLNRVLLDESNPESPRWDDALEAFPGFGEGAALNEQDDKLLRTMVNRLTERIESSEDLSTKALTGLDQALTHLAQKITASDTRLQSQLEETRSSIDTVRSGQDDLTGRISSLEESDGGSGYSLETVKAVEDTMLKLARRLYQHENDVAARLHETDQDARKQADTVRKAAESLTHRIDRLENRATDFADMSKRRDGRTNETLTEVQRATESLRQRIEHAERHNGDAAHTLETSFARLDERLIALEGRNSSDYVDLERRFDRMSDEVASIISDTRTQMATALSSVATEPRVDRLESALTQALQRIDDAERRQGDNMGKLGDEITRFAGAIENRITESERRSQEARSEDQLERRLEENQKASKAAMRQMGEEVTRLGRSLADRITQSEDRSAEAVESATERMAAAVERLESSRSTREEDLEDRLRQSEERTAQRIEDALTGVQDRMSSVREQTEEALTPVQRAMAALADRLESIENKNADEEPAEAPKTAEPAAKIDFDTPLAPPPQAEVPRTVATPSETDPFLTQAPAAPTQSPALATSAPVLRAPVAAPKAAPVEPAAQPHPAAPASGYQPNSARAGATASPDFLAAARERTRLSGNEFTSAPNRTTGSKFRHVLIPAILLSGVALTAMAGIVAWERFGSPAVETPSVAGGFVERLEADLAAETGISPAEPSTPAGTSSPANREPELAAATPTEANAAPNAASVENTPPSNVVADASNSFAPATAAETLPEPAPSRASPTRAPSGQTTLESAAADGSPVARYQLGLRQLESGQLANAVILLRRAAEQGVPAAQYRYAKLLESGEGVDIDLEAARQWTERAANSGHRRAMHNLGVMYFYGAGAEQNYEVAARWFQEAALLGLTDSQFNLALLFEQGQGVPLSLPDAYAWYTIASSETDPTAAQRAGELVELMEPQALAEAQQAALSFRPQPINAEANGLYRNQSWDRSTTADPEAVRRTQAFLSVLGYGPGQIDGLIGERTRQAIMAFENDQGLPRTGRVDAVLLERLERAAAG